MKTVKLMAALFMVALCVGIVSCSKDEPGDGVFNSGKRVTKILYDEGNSQEFTYSNDRLVRIVWRYADVSRSLETDLAVTYSDNQVIMKGKYDGHDNTVFTYTLGSNGFAASCNIKERGSETYETYEYSADGYLTKITEDNGTRISTSILTYAKGNLISWSTNNWRANFTYTNIENKGNLTFWLGDDYYLGFYAGVLGKFNKNLMSVRPLTNLTRI